MGDDVRGSASQASPRRGHLRYPLRGLASEGAERAVRHALDGLPGILDIKVWIGMAVAEVLFDETLVSADDVRARLELAGRRPPKGASHEAPGPHSV